MRGGMNWKTFIGIVVSAIFLYFAFREVDIDILLNGLRKADYRYLIPVIFFIFLSMWFRAVRWHYLMKSIKNIGLWNLFSATAIGLMANNLLPARLGEFVRAVMIGRKENISKSSSFATIVVERVFDGLTVLAFLGLVLILDLFSFPPIMREAAWLTVIFYFLAIIFLVLIKFRRETALAIVSLAVKPLPCSAGRKVIGLLDSFVDGLKILNNGWDLVRTMILSLLVWIPNIAIIWVLFISFDFSLPLYAPVVLFVILTIGIMIPSAPGFVGTVQYCCVLGLGMFGIGKSEAISYSIIYHLGIYITITGTGILCLFLEGLSRSEIKNLFKTGIIG